MYACITHCTPDVWYTVDAQEISVLFSFYDDHLFAALAGSLLKSLKECLLFYVTYHLLSLF